MSSNLQTIYYGSGEEPKPAINPEHLRLYSHELCPFVERSVLALRAKEIPFQLCQTDLEVKAEWHMKLNGGLIPVLESPDGTLVNESGFISEFAGNFAPAGQGLAFWPHETAPKGDVAANMQTVKHKLQMQRFDKLAFIWWAPYMAAFKDAEKNAAMVAKFPEIEAFMKDNMGEASFLSGTDKPMYIDMHAFPMVERIILLEYSHPDIWRDLDIKAHLPISYEYVHRMMEYPHFRNYHASPEAWVEHCKMQDARTDGIKQQLRITYLNREKYN